MKFERDDIIALLNHAKTWIREHRAAAAGIAAGLVVLLLVIIFAASMTASTGHMRNLGEELTGEYQQLKEHVLANDGDGVQQDAARIGELAGALEHETHAWVWNVASAFEGSDGDVQKLRTLASINVRLANEVTLPFAQSYAEFAQTNILNSDKTINPLALAAHADAPKQLLESLRSLHPAISECNEQVKQIGQAKNSGLQQVIESARTTLEQLDTSFTALENALFTTGGIGDTITSLLP